MAGNKEYWAFCDTTFAVADSRRVRKMLDSKWKDNLEQLETRSEQQLLHYATTLAVQNHELFKLLAMSPANDAFTVLRTDYHDIDSGAHVRTFQLPKIMDAPEHYNYHVAHFKEKALPTDNVYELHASSDDFFERGEPCYPRPLDPNYEREGQLAAFSFSPDAIHEDPLRYSAIARSANLTLRAVLDFAEIEIPRFPQAMIAVLPPEGSSPSS